MTRTHTHDSKLKIDPAFYALKIFIVYLCNFIFMLDLTNDRQIRIIFCNTLYFIGFVTRTLGILKLFNTIISIEIITY